MYRPAPGYNNYYDDNSEGEPLVEEFDPNFEPDEEEVLAYAVDSLGMNLPEDQMLLYLAKEALKKPLPDTWGAYQRQDGYVYYKHKVTQEKVFDHPIDVEYRRLYQQEKDKIARRTLKSKTSKPAGIAAMKLLGNIAKYDEFSSHGNSHGNSAIGSNIDRQQSHLMQNISGISEPNEAEIARYLYEYLRRYYASLARDFEEFRFREDKDLTERERRLRYSHQSELDRINRNSQLPVSFDDRVRQEKESIRRQYEQEQYQAFKRELRDEEERLRNEAVRTEKDLEQYWQLKMNDVEERNTQKLEVKSALLERMREDLEQEKIEREQKYREYAKRAKDQFDRNKEEFSRDADKQLQIYLQKISREREDRVRQRKDYLYHEYQRIRKLLKSAPEDKLMELIERKSRLQDLSDKKYESNRSKELQLIERNFKSALEKEKMALRERLEQQYQLLYTQLSNKLDEKLKQELAERASHSSEQVKLKEKEIFDVFREKLQQYQLGRNKKLITARQNFIEEIEATKDRLEKELTVQSFKLLAREKEFELANRYKMVRALRDDIKLGERQLRKYELDRKLYRLQDEKEVTEALKSYLSGLKQQQDKKYSSAAPYILGQLPLKNYLPSVFEEHRMKLEYLKKTLAYDKNLLGRVATHLQQTSMLPFYDRQKVLRSDIPSDMQLTKLQAISTGKNELIKKYNSDIRKLRYNEKVITDLYLLLKKAEYDEYNALLELRRLKIHYEYPELRAELEQSAELTSQLYRLKTNIGPAKFPTASNPDLLTTKRVQDLFDDHSRFLSNVKQELNSRLWEIRGMASHGNYRPF